MSSLTSRYGLQGLERQGIHLADQPGLVVQGKSLFFFSLTRRPPAGSDPLGALKTEVQVAIAEARRYEGFAELHLYYLDADGHVLLSLSSKPPETPKLKFDGTLVTTTPVNHLKVERRFEARGRSGLRQRVVEETREVYAALEKFQAAYQLGWGGLFFAREEGSRINLFQHFEPVRKGAFKPEEVLTDLTFTLQLWQAADARSMIGYRPVSTSLDSATLDEALNWA
ncbi:MAG: hypothetical protein WCG80_08565 [Spirochaetales bacterium]